MTDADKLRFERVGAEQARTMREQVRSTYVSSHYSDIATEGDVFRTAESFMERFDSYAANPYFDMVIAYWDREPIGQTWGWPLGPQSRWWTAVVETPDDDFTVETGTRTFALSELMISRSFGGRGIAHLLHDMLLDGRDESRATLLVSPTNTRALEIYLHWGWKRSSARLQPPWDGAPTFYVLMLDLGARKVATDRHP